MLIIMLIIMCMHMLFINELLFKKYLVSSSIFLEKLYFVVIISYHFICMCYILYKAFVFFDLLASFFSLLSIMILLFLRGISVCCHSQVTAIISFIYNLVLT